MNGGEDGYLTFNGLRHHYLRWGDPGKDPVVLLHGLFDHARTWEPVAAELAKTRCVYALDLRGHGETEHAPGGYLVWAFARDLYSFLDELNLEVFDLVAHGLGSRVAMAYARDHSHRIRRLVLAEMGPEATTEAANRTEDGFETEAAAIAHFREAYPEQTKEFVRRQLLASLELDERSGQLVFRFDRGLEDATGKATAVEIPFLWESLEHIASPTLVVRGERSGVLTKEVVAEMVARLAKGEAAMLPGAGHRLPREAPGELAALVSAFLDR